MMISADQVVANVCDLFEKIGGTKLDEIRLSLTATELVLGGPFFTENDVADRVERLTDRLRNSQIDLFQDMARLRGIIYARSEEHTSELQSLMRISYAVFCLKKKTQNRDSDNHT